MPEGKTKDRVSRRAMLRRLTAGAGAAGVAAALPGAAQAAARHAMSANAPASPQAAPTMALGAAEPPDPSLSAADWKPRFFDDHQAQTVLTIGDLLIPETDTPGARAAQVDRFIDLLLDTDAPGTGEDYEGSDLGQLLVRRGTLEAQKRYVRALNWLDGYTMSQYRQPFTGLDREHQESVLDLLTHSTSSPEVGRGPELFGVIKSSIIAAYYSSEIGALRELKYQTNPFQTGMPECEHPEGR